MEKTAVAILGSGNIGTDLMYKLKRSNFLRPVIMAGIVADSEGLARARQEGLAITSEGIEGLLKQKETFDIVFDATTAAAHKIHAPLLHDRKKDRHRPNSRRSWTLRHPAGQSRRAYRREQR